MNKTRMSDPVAASAAASIDNILEVRNLKTYFYTEDGVVKAVDGVDFAVRRAVDQDRGEPLVQLLVGDGLDDLHQCRQSFAVDLEDVPAE